ncbi:MAG: ornithine carbamoyltransferase [Spirochaetes bacterium]|nr:ornithine carbamoyltransferase [Spirochaetota bacterium]
MKIPELKTKHLLSIADLSKEEIIKIFNFAVKLKKDIKRGRKHKYLSGKTLGMIFEKSSTRTRVSFETGIFQLGGHALFLDSSDIQIGRGETIADTAKVLSRYVDGIMIRTFSHSNVEELAANADIPVINGLSDRTHPCQALADLFTIYERVNDLTKVKLFYIGDGNNVANSLILGASILGMNISAACPEIYSPDKEVLDKAAQFSLYSGAKINITPDIDKAAQGADFIYTDVWVSMGQEKELKKKKKILAKYKISVNTVEKCAPGCLVMHCLPAHRGEEIDSEIMDSDRSLILEQAENRLHVQKAVMCALMR